MIVGCKSSIIPIDGSVIGIGNGAFFSCRNLTNISIPACVTSIGDIAFSVCPSLTSIYFDGTVSQWNAISKGYSWNSEVPATQVICTDGVVSLK